MNSFELFRKTVERIENIGIVGAEAEVRFFFEEKLGISFREIILNKEVDYWEKIGIIDEYVERRKRREPVQYIVGHTWFFGEEVELKYGVLIPRNETELLVEKVLSFIKSGYKLLEIGVGSGCIGRAILSNFGENLRYLATDINPVAIEIARKNVGDDRRFEVIYDDLYSGVERFDLIVSNPPYIGMDEYGKLEPELKFEPREALIGGSSGIEIIERIISMMDRILYKDGHLIMEIGYNQAKKIEELSKKYGHSLLEVVRDYNGFDRIVILKVGG